MRNWTLLVPSLFDQKVPIRGALRCSEVRLHPAICGVIIGSPASTSASTVIGTSRCAIFHCACDGIRNIFASSALIVIHVAKNEKFGIVGSHVVAAVAGGAGYRGDGCCRCRARRGGGRRGARCRRRTAVTCTQSNTKTNCQANH